MGKAKANKKSVVRKLNKAARSASKKKEARSEGSKDSSINDPIAANIDVFRKHLQGTRINAYVMMGAMLLARKQMKDKLTTFINQKCKIERKQKETTTFNVPLEHAHEYEKLQKEFTDFDMACQIVPKSSVIMLVSHFDYLVGGLIQSLYNKQPGVINLSEKQLTLSQLNDFGSFKAAKEYFLEKEIESVLRKSHSEQFEWLEKTFDIKLRNGLNEWPDFIELTERRNLFVHTNGTVSSQYLKTCKENKVKNIEHIKVGTQLFLNREYFTRAYQLIYALGIKLAHVLWRKIVTSELKEATLNYMALTFDLLREEEYSLAAHLLDFIFETPAIRKFPDDTLKRIHIINRALAYKWQGEQTKCIQIINEEDWSSTKKEFELAVLVCKNKYEEAARLMEEIGDRSDYFDRNSYQQWPLFKEFRKTKPYLRTFKNIFGTTGYDVKKKNEELKLDEHKKQKQKNHKSRYSGSREPAKEKNIRGKNKGSRFLNK